MPDKAAIIRDLVQEHFRLEDGLEKVAVMRDVEGGPIKLLEVNASTLSTGSVEPFAFSPTGDVPYVTEIAEITPEEFERLRLGKEIKTPAGWTFSDVVDVIERPAA